MRGKLTNRCLALLLLPLLLPVALSCRRRNQAAPRGVLRVSGAWALYPLMVRWADVYQRQTPGLRIEVSAGGAGKGMSDCLSGLVDLAMVSRDLRPEELRQGARPVPVARDAVFAVVSAGATPDLIRTGLTRQAAQETFLQEKGTGLRIYTRSDACGAAETWAAWLGARQEQLQGTAVFGDPGIAEAVRRDGRAMGYNNLAFAFDPRTGLPPAGLQIVCLDRNGNGRVDPDEDVTTRAKAMAAVAEGRYPSPPARDLFLVSKGAPSPEVRSFLTWILNQGQALASENGFVPVGERGRAALTK